MTRTALGIAITLLLSLAAVAEPPKFSTAWLPAMTQLEAAVLAGDVAALRSSMAVLDAMTTANAQERELLDYAEAYAAWRLLYQRGVEVEEKKTLIVSARSHLEAALKVNPKNAEAHALLSSVLGSEIGLAPVRAMVLGPQSSMERDTSLRLEPSNPRVLLLAGTNLFHTPEMYGGGAEKAEPLLRRALQAFAAEPAQRPWPNWGRFDAHIWLGQVLEKVNKRDAARAEYEEALKLAPQSGYVRAILLPRVTPKS